MSGNINDFTDLTSYKGYIKVAGGRKLSVEGIGIVNLTILMPDGSNKH